MTIRRVEAGTAHVSNITNSENLDAKKIELLQNYLNGSLILGSFIFFINLYLSVQAGKILSIVVTLLLFAILFATTFLRRLKAGIRIGCLFVVYFGAGIFSLISTGINSNGILYFFIAVLMVGILSVRKLWIPVSLLSGISILAIGFLFNFDLLKIDEQTFKINSTLLWVSTSVILFFLIYIVTLALVQYLNEIRKIIKGVDQNEQILITENDTLSHQLESQMRNVDRRQSLLLISRQIYREISGISSNEELMQKTTELIQSQFECNFVGIYLSDENNEFAILKAGSTSADRSVQNLNNRLRITDESAIGSTILHGEPRTTREIQNEDSNNQGNPSPEIHSELAIPLRQADRNIGALDFQSDKANSFDKDELGILQSIVDQFLILFEKSNQIEKLKRSVLELEQAYDVYTENFWDVHLSGSRKHLSYQYMNNKLEKKSSIEADEIEVLQTERKMIISADPQDEDARESTMLLPIKIRNQIIGVLKIKYQGKTVPRDLEQLIDAASARLSSSIENARLLEEIQEQANREKMVSTIANKVRSATNIDAILQTTVTELGRTLGVNEVRIQLKAIENE